jgi:FlaA1/EpsC-like NDP-sugar epimerase
MSYIFALVDGALVMSAVLWACILHSEGMDALLFVETFSVTKIMLIVAVVQMTLYSLDLMDLKFLRQRIQMSVQLFKALGLYTAVLVFIYFIFPSLAIGHRPLFVGLGMTLLVTFAWRILYPWITGKALFKEKVLIVGTGEAARKIYKEMGENGNDAYEIVGFVDENGRKIGDKVKPDDHRGLQSNLFHLQNLSN